jgi:hypothetical protein
MTNPHETYCNETATHFVAVRGQQRTRKDCATMDDAKAYAATYGDKRTMVYMRSTPWATAPTSATHEREIENEQP